MSTEDTQDAIPRGYWQDASGALIPVAKIKDIDKARNTLVTQLCENAKRVSADLAGYKTEVMEQVAAFVQASAEEYNAPMRGAAGKGNVTLISFDGRYKIVRQVQESLVFDERLQIAKSIIDSCVHVWSKGANKNVQALVNHAFQVDKAGKVSTGRVLGLRQLKIDDPEWERAMAAIADSMKTASSKSYVRFYERDAHGEYQAIALDMAAV